MTIVFGTEWSGIHWECAVEMPCVPRVGEHIRFPDDKSPVPSNNDRLYEVSTVE